MRTVLMILSGVVLIGMGIAAMMNLTKKYGVAGAVAIGLLLIVGGVGVVVTEVAMLSEG